jgi:hypothetical protein
MFGFQYPKVGDDQPRATPCQPQFLSLAFPIAEPDGRSKITSLYECPPCLSHDQHDTSCRCGNFRCAAGAWEASPRTSVWTNDGRVDVSEAIELRTSQKTHVNATGLEPIGKYLWDAHHRISGIPKLTVPDGQW